MHVLDSSLSGYLHLFRTRERRKLQVVVKRRSKEEVQATHQMKTVAVMTVKMIVTQMKITLTQQPHGLQVGQVTE